ncbi:MAG: hypothetical protein EZS28_044190 [Streblomastix strix]|uniref:Uncharacterized protein n=1 Tax=Streblomastix strix TaxID=222440 RepID=A0A5J4TQT3_9EUKA|nr:MAG: hypothetical protein EZS28_044190 [Streblomastix strix]
MSWSVSDKLMIISLSNKAGIYDSGLQGRIQEVDRIPDSVLPADGKSLGFHAAIYSTQGGRTTKVSTNRFS